MNQQKQLKIFLLRSCQISDFLYLLLHPQQMTLSYSLAIKQKLPDGNSPILPSLILPICLFLHSSSFSSLVTVEEEFLLSKLFCPHQPQISFSTSSQLSFPHPHIILVFNCFLFPLSKITKTNKNPFDSSLSLSIVLSLHSPPQSNSYFLYTFILQFTALYSLCPPLH